MHSPGKAESWPLHRGASSHPDPLVPQKALLSGEELQVLKSSWAQSRPASAPDKGGRCTIVAQTAQALHQPLPRTTCAIRVPADPNCFELRGWASAGSLQVQAGPLPATWAVNPGCKTTTAQSQLSLPVSSYPDGGHGPPPPCDKDHARRDGVEAERYRGRVKPGAALTAEMMSEVFSAMCWTPAPP